MLGSQGGLNRVGAAVSNALPRAGATLNLDFTLGTLDSRITFTRASSATFFDSAGVLQTAASGAARFTYDPATLQPQGLLIEEQRTNSIRNNTMQGAVAGTPGTSPTNWVMPGTINGLTQQIVGVGTESGITYIDIRYSGTTTAASNHSVSFEAANQISASSGQTWTRSGYFKIAAGATTNLNSISHSLQGRNAGNTAFTETFTNDIAPSLTATLTRFSTASTLADANTAFVRSQITFFYNTGVAIDITLRIGLPQLELGAFATSVIPTTTTALTRNADAASMTGTNFSSWYRADEGTIYVEAFSGSADGNSLAVSDGTNNNRFQFATGASNTVWNPFVITSGSSVATLTQSASYPPKTNSKLVLAYATNNFAASVSGQAPVTDTSGNLPVVDRLLLGSSGSGTISWNSHIRRIAFYPQRLANAQLQALTA
jgi:hypothetical protein